jgi:hypothetical protein
MKKCCFKYSFYLVTFGRVVGVVERELLHPPFAMAVRTQEGDPASVVASGLRNVRLRVDLGSELRGFAVGSENAQNWHVMFGLASEAIETFLKYYFINHLTDVKKQNWLDRYLKQ